MLFQLPALAGATVILVHGAFADGSSWNKVTARLQQKAVTVVSVQNPLSSLADDVTATRRAIAAAKGPVVLVGHSWGGAVITEAGVDPKVKALVYVAAFAPDAGMSVNDLGKGAPPPAWLATAQISSDGFITLPAKSIAENFSQDLPAMQSKVLAATQGPTAAHAFDEKLSHAAWHDRPTWYVVAKQDHMIAPAAERAMAAMMHAHVTEIDSSHVPMLSHPEQVAAVIEDAITSTSERQASAR
jgi:pimeloyl-ACP methyl ester carboxylesterase